MSDGGDIVCPRWVFGMAEERGGRFRLELLWLGLWASRPLDGRGRSRLPRWTLLSSLSASISTTQM